VGRCCLWLYLITFSSGALRSKIKEGAAPGIRQPVASLSPRRPVLSRGSVLVRFVLNTVALGYVFVPVLVLRSSPVSVMPPMLLSH